LAINSYTIAIESYRRWLAMFVVKKPEATNKTIRLPIELIDKLNEIANEKCVSFNNLVQQCIEYALNDMDEREENGKSGLRKKG
jgi:hypothetical protein